MEESKVASIIAAARRRFAHYGLGKTTMNEIAADVGMSKAALYYYFPDKERIFVAVVEEDIAAFVALIEEVITRQSKASFKLKKFVSLRNSTLVQLDNLGKIENPSPSDYFNPIFDELKAKYLARERDLIRRILQIGIDERHFSKIPVDTYTDLFLSTLTGLRIYHLTAHRTPDTVDRITQQSTLFLEIFLKSIHIPQH